MSDSEDNRLAGRARRYVQVGTRVGTLAAKLAGERYFGLKLNKGEHAEDLKQVLGGLKGPLMKVAQILATIPDALPEEYARELQQLQSNAPAMGWLFVKRRMAAELGPDWRAKFGSFEAEAAAAASLGQVHRATTKAGQAIACKLQYPDMQSAVEADLKQLKLAMSVYERYDKAISTARIYQELSARLREELDYELESRHMALYGLMLKDEAGVHVPDYVPELSTKRLLSMSWLEGGPLLGVVD
ncbi:MAG: AarF/ABC1/UbiB kinase family protein, partial [Alphaproteobacteria bacterium]|nr:AarF/ABC1/UbiB kinase family protein [Alphaproteobacteria bacterium]